MYEESTLSCVFLCFVFADYFVSWPRFPNSDLTLICIYGTVWGTKRRTLYLYLVLVLFLRIRKILSLNCKCRFPRKFDDYVVPLEMKYLLAERKYRGLNIIVPKIEHLAVHASSLLTYVCCKVKPLHWRTPN